jgi:hypothetical protein
VIEITDHLPEIERRISGALDRSKRRDRAVTIVAVSKGQPAAAIVKAHAAGLADFGESYVQEAVDKIDAAALPGIRWHFIGRIQANKTKPIAERFDWVQTIDRERIAARLDAQRPEDVPPLNVLIQLKLEGDAQKGGIRPDELAPLAERIAALPRLKLRGLMSMPPAGLGEREARAYFSAVAAEALKLERRGFALDTLSMGMSDDFEIAVECGSTCVRIGTALFGAREPRPVVSLRP